VIPVVLIRFPLCESDSLDVNPTPIMLIRFPLW